MPIRAGTTQNTVSWFALYVKPRHEKVVACALTGKGYEPFLPLYKGAWASSSAPLFPSYVFCRFDPKQRLPILTIPGVFSILGNANAPIPIRDTEVAALKRLVDSHSILRPLAYLRTGQRVRIEAGPLRGLEGIFLRGEGSDHLVISVGILQRSVAVTLQAGWVRALPAAA